MDPLSQAVVGAALSQSFAKKNEIKVATWAGVLGGLLPDIDVLIKSAADPLLQIEYHRSFTHSFLFVPILALPVAALVKAVNQGTNFFSIYIYAFLGVLTHGLLDACTSYGTQLFWPFSSHRVAWNIISIIDPLFTLPVLVVVVWVAVKKLPSLARILHVFMLTYFIMGWHLRNRAEEGATTLAQQRQISVIRVEAKPSIGNLVLWRTLVESLEHEFYVDAIHVLPWGEAKIYEGGKVARWLPPSGLNQNSVLAHDIKRFEWFSDGYLAKHPGYPDAIGDLRYSTVPNSLKPLWGIVLSTASDQHVEYLNFRVVNQEIWGEFKRMLLRQ